jgi:hypothetical protein
MLPKEEVRGETENAYNQEVSFAGTAINALRVALQRGDLVPDRR